MSKKSVPAERAGLLYSIATPIGNLEDITLRALRILKEEVDIIFAEDTRVTQKLLRHYAITKPIRRYDEHVAGRMHGEIAGLLRSGRRIALVSDAGTPGISDPGARLVAYVRDHAPEARMVPVPGPSALITALSVAGISADAFVFLGYPPHKKGRKKFFECVRESAVRPVVLYESPHRLLRTFADITEHAGSGTLLAVAKELTKLYEEVWQGTAVEAARYFVREKSKGEFVVIIY